MKGNPFVKGTIMLTISNFIVKFIGAAQLIVLSRLLGGEGLGLYNIAFPMYVLAISISSAGIPVALSILVAEKSAVADYYGANRIFKVALTLMIIIGSVATIILYFGAGWLLGENLIRDHRAYYSIIALVPSVFFVTIIACYRGYFQGFQIMKPTAVSQVVEQLFRVMTMVCLAYLLLPYGLEYAAAGASFGAFAGSVAALAMLVFYYNKYRDWIFSTGEKTTGESSFIICVRIVKLSFPVLLAAVMAPVISNIDILIVPARLEAAGYSIQQSTELFGYLTGMSGALINFPTVFTASLAVSLVPAISNSFAQGNYHSIHYRISEVIRLTVIILLPSSVGLYLLAEPISKLLFDSPGAGNVIAILSVGVILLGLHQVTTAILQGLGRTGIPMVNMLVAASVKVGLTWVLTARSELGINGAAWATNADLAVAVVMNMFFIYRFAGLDISYREMTKILVSSLLMGAAVVPVYRFGMAHLAGNALSTVAAIIFGSLVYLLVLLMLKGLYERDIVRIPVIGEKIISLKEKFNR